MTSKRSGERPVISEAVASARAGGVPAQSSLASIGDRQVRAARTVPESGGVIAHAAGCPGAARCTCYLDRRQEQRAVKRIKALYGAEHVIVRLRSCAQANALVMRALLTPGDGVLEIGTGSPDGHRASLTLFGSPHRVIARRMHGPVEAAGTKVVRQLARQGRPKLIVVGFGPAPRIWRLEEFRALADEVGAHLVVDMSQAAGLVSTGLLPNPVDIADIVTTIHDNVADWSGGAILCRSSYAQRLESGLPREGGGSEAGQTRNKLDGLTAKERAVAERVSQGLTNQEVADDLFVSAKTIEYHLGNIYAKLGIRTRRDLRRHYGTQCAQCGRSCAESA